MKRIGIAIIAFAAFTCLNSKINAQERDMSNPFFKEYNTPFQVPPFNDIKLEHFKPAMQAGIAEQLAETKAITDN